MDKSQWKMFHPVKIAKNNKCHKDSSEKGEVLQRSRMKFLVCLFLHGEHCECDGKCVNEFNKVFLSHNSHCPKSVEKAMAHLSHGVGKPNWQQNMPMMLFGEVEVACHCCHEKKNTVTDCPKWKEDKPKKHEKVQGLQLNKQALVHWNITELE